MAVRQRPGQPQNRHQQPRGRRPHPEQVAVALQLPVAGPAAGSLGDVQAPCASSDRLLAADCGAVGRRVLQAAAIRAQQAPAAPGAVSGGAVGPLRWTACCARHRSPKGAERPSRQPGGLRPRGFVPRAPRSSVRAPRTCPSGSSGLLLALNDGGALRPRTSTSAVTNVPVALPPVVTLPHARLEADQQPLLSGTHLSLRERQRRLPLARARRRCGRDSKRPPRGPEKRAPGARRCHSRCHTDVTPMSQTV